MKTDRLFLGSMLRPAHRAMVAILIVVLFSARADCEDRARKQLPPPPKPEQEFRRMLPKKAPRADMVFIGKAVCSLRRSVEMPCNAIIVGLEVCAGQAVQQGAIMASYHLHLGPGGAEEGTKELKRDTMPSPVSTHRQADSSVALGNSPAEGVIVAPISGHVVWVNPELRVGAELEAGSQAFVLGVMDPMLLRANIYEEEALRLAVGDRGTMYPESLPWKTFRAQVSRIAWTPLSLDPLQPSYYEVEFTVPNQELLLREGLRVIIHLFKPLPRAQQVEMGGKQDAPKPSVK